MATVRGCGDSNQLTIDIADIERHLDALQAVADANGGIRASGTRGFDASADYVAAQLEEMGYEVDRQGVEFTFFDEEEPVSLRIGTNTWDGGDWLHANLYSGDGDITAIPQTVGFNGSTPTLTAGCDDADWTGFEGGRIAIVPPGGCFSRDKVLVAQEHDAAAIISLVPSWDDPGETLRPTLIDPSLIDIPAVVAGADPIDELLDAARAEEQIELVVDVIEEPANDDNVFGELAGESDEVLMLGGHLDSVLEGPGLNDNASGVATLLAIAEALRNEEPPTLTVRFAFWAAEEFGTLGSLDYVSNLSDADRARVIGYINLDMVGSPNAAHYVYLTPTAEPGSVDDEITQRLLAAFEDLGAAAVPIDLGGGSDHAPFSGFGIPTGGLFSGLAPLSPDEAQLFGGVANQAADPCYHLACDNRSNVDVETALLFGNAVARVVEEMAY